MQLSYDPKGNIYTCDEGKIFEEFKLGNVKTNKYHQVLCSEETKAIIDVSINDNIACEICAFKPYCGICPVCSFAETNNIIPKIPNQRCEILKGMFDHIFDKLLNDEEYKETFLNWIKN